MSEVMVCVFFLILKLSLGPWQSLSTCRVKEMPLLPGRGEYEIINSGVLSIFFAFRYTQTINCCYSVSADVWDLQVADSY